jgi:hypothetical protein
MPTITGRLIQQALLLPLCRRHAGVCQESAPQALGSVVGRPPGVEVSGETGEALGGTPVPRT